MVDRISRLPDEILSHILSFLFTKQVVTTSVISKRWRPLWLLVPTLYFSDHSFRKNSSFINFVYTTIFSRDILQPIKEFTLIPVKSFRNVKFLRLDELDEDIPVFPYLIHIELILGGTLTWSLVLDMLNHCPKLETCILEDIHNADDDWPYPYSVPECFSLHFRKCFLSPYTGEERQRRFLRYVMQNSTSLHTMTIRSGYFQNDKKNFDMIKELASCPRSSAICELLFESLACCLSEVGNCS